MNKFVPHRKCIACQKRKPKEELLRFVLIDDTIQKDCDKKILGRGFYLCNQIECIDKCQKKKLPYKIFKRQNIDISAIKLDE